MCVRFNDDNINGKLLYWAAEPSPLGSFLKTAEYAYGDYTNMGVAIKDSEGVYKFRMMAPQAYLSEDELWQRHFHFIHLENKKSDIERRVIKTVSCFPQDSSAKESDLESFIKTHDINTVNQSMYVDYDGYVKAKMHGIKCICALEEKYAISKTDICIPVEEVKDKRVLKKKTKGLEKREPYLVYCAKESCNAAKKLISKLQEIGLTNVYYYAKGKEGVPTSL